MAGSGSSAVAVVKTLLVTDLVDSTKLLASLGDERGAEIFEQTDRIARDLLVQFNGREIDRTDGFLILFDRPIDATRYALAYHEALSSMAARLGIALGARAGIHLGEVYLRENSVDDVARGAKALEVEGLAKATTARVASIATAKQTLLTSAAFDLVRRAAVGGSLTDAPLQWLAHGPYLFKGVDEPIDVFEVGIVGVAPLAAPTDTEKARRQTAGALLSGAKETQQDPEPQHKPGPKTRSRAAWITALAALAIAGAIVVEPKLARRAPAPEAAPSVPTVPPVALAYWITVQKYRGGRPFEDPFRLAQEINFEKDYRIRLHFNSPRSGFLYLLSEAPGNAPGVSPYNLIAAAGIEGNREKQIPEQSWFQFDDEKGSEKVWIVWSGKTVPELEAAAKFINTKDRGTINDAGIRDAVQAFLKLHAASPPVIEKDDQTQETRVRTSRDPAVYLLKLEHH